MSGRFVYEVKFSFPATCEPVPSGSVHDVFAINLLSTTPAEKRDCDFFLSFNTYKNVLGFFKIFL